MASRSEKTDPTKTELKGNPSYPDSFQARRSQVLRKARIGGFLGAALASALLLCLYYSGIAQLPPWDIRTRLFSLMAVLGSAILGFMSPILLTRDGYEVWSDFCSPYLV
ncbi:hypothetical protein F5B20DRAFT_528262, partial [Whalleya microplaca]